MKLIANCLHHEANKLSSEQLEIIFNKLAIDSMDEETLKPYILYKVSKHVAIVMEDIAENVYVECGMLYFM